MPPLGRHMPLSPNPPAALATARALGCTAVQLFASSPRVWAPPAEHPAATADLAAALRTGEFAPVVVHAAYLINLASNNAETRAKSAGLLRWTLARAAAIGAGAVVLHVGSHGGDGLAVGLERIIAALAPLVREVPDGPALLLENDVGAGYTIGADFATLAGLLAALADSWGARAGICLDTAHLWGAGHDIGTPEAARATLDAAEAAFNLTRVGVIHLNDTETALGGHRDHHARLGEGIIGLDGLRAFLRDPRLAGAAVILETPINTLPDSDQHDWDDERQRLATARALLAP